MKARALVSLLPAGAAAGLVTALLDSGVKSGILLLLAAAAVAALRKSAAATRHLVWTSAMACALAMPILSLCLPRWRVLPSWMGANQAAQEIGSVSAMLGQLQSPTISQVTPTTEDQRAPSPDNNGLSPTESSSPIPASAPLAIQPIGPALSRSTGVLLAWAIGAGLLLLPLLRSAWSLHRLSRRSRVIRDGVLADTLNAIANELRLRRNVTIHEGSAHSMPMVWGMVMGSRPGSARRASAPRMRPMTMRPMMSPIMRGRLPR